MSCEPASMFNLLYFKPPPYPTLVQNKIPTLGINHSLAGKKPLAGTVKSTFKKPLMDYIELAINKQNDPAIKELRKNLLRIN